MTADCSAAHRHEIFFHTKIACPGANNVLARVAPQLGYRASTYVKGLRQHWEKSQLTPGRSSATHASQCNASILIGRRTVTSMSSISARARRSRPACGWWPRERMTTRDPIPPRGGGLFTWANRGSCGNPSGRRVLHAIRAHMLSVQSRLRRTGRGRHRMKSAAIVVLILISAFLAGPVVRVENQRDALYVG